MALLGVFSSRVFFFLFFSSNILIIVSGQQCSFVSDVIIGNGGDEYPATSAQDCCAMCLNDPTCQAFTFITNANVCYVKQDPYGNQTMPDRISGYRNGPPPYGPPYFQACLNVSFPFCNTSMPLEDRINDLVQRVSLDEAPAQLTARESPPIPALGLPSYYWGTNAIHGVENVNCIGSTCPTMFPNPNALGATFNMSLVQNMAQVIGIEMRAYMNLGQHDGLDSWSPNINVNHDPRWGRNQEIPSEDPLVTALYGVAYTTGIQNGTDDNYVLGVVTLKHYAVYNVEDNRLSFNAVAANYDIADTFWKAFEASVVEGHALGVMCSYNAINGVPACADSFFMTTVLRDTWGFQGYVTSDSGAVEGIWADHHYTNDPLEGVSLALEAGCDICSGGEFQQYLVAAVNASKVPLSNVEEALYRTYKLRFLLGQFDPVEHQVYRTYGFSDINSTYAQELSLFSTLQSMVLLKNDQNTLPFPKGKKIAVIGPNGLDGTAMAGNYDPPFNYIPSVLDAITWLNEGGSTTGTIGYVNNDTSSGVAAAEAADLVVLAVGLNEVIEHEGLDRTDIGLPDIQSALIQAVLNVGKPTVMVLINGGSVSCDVEKETVPAILEAFYPGYYGGQAIAEVIFGDYNPGGKLPFTVYPRNYTSLVNMTTMSMTAGPGRSYRYYTGTPLWPFGFGLSYTNFSLSWVSGSQGATFSQASDSTTFCVSVGNIGNLAGDEVVFAYFAPLHASTPLPGNASLLIKQLFAFQRVSLDAGAKEEVCFSLSFAQMVLYDDNGNGILYPGQYTVILSRGIDTELDLTAPIHAVNPSPVVLKPFPTA